MADRGAAQGATSTPLDQGMIQRAVRGLAAAVRYTLKGDPTAFFGPQQPLAPVAQDDAKGRLFDYPSGANLSYKPRAYDAVDFATLRGLADSYDLVRLAIETRKDQMGKLEWQINRVDGADLDPLGQSIQDFLQTPDGEHEFDTWLRMALEELLVIDAPTCYLRPTLGGKTPYALELIDGATIHRVIDDTGRTPTPPQPAYQQIIKGLPAVDYSREELVYMPRNPRTHKFYGFSPVEQVLMIINIGLRRQTYQLQYYTEGNIPEMLFAVPASWTPKQLAELQLYFDEILAGDSAARRRVRFMPGDAKPVPTHAEPLFDQFDEWIARVICYCFSLPPNAFVKQQNRATATNAQEVALEEGLAPLMGWTVRFINRLIRLGWHTTDYEFAWLDAQDVDPLVQAQVDQIYAGTKIRSVQEIRDDHDWGPAPKELTDPPPAPAVVPGLPAAGGPPEAKPGAAADAEKRRGAGGAGTKWLRKRDPERDPRGARETTY